MLLFTALWLCVVARDFYKILGVSKNASVKEIKHKYRELSKKYHPDSEEGDEEKFLEIRDAAEVLTDDELRKKYDMFGEEGLNGEGGHGSHGQGGSHGSHGHPFGPFTQTFVFSSSQGRQPFVFRTFGGQFNPFGRHNGPHNGPTKEEPDLFANDTNIKSITRTNWDTTVETETYASMILYYHSGCRGCQEFKKDYMALAKQFAPFFLVGAVNCKAEPSLCRSAAQLPTLRLHSRQSKLIFEYKGEKLTASHVTKWLNDKLPLAGTKIGSNEQFERWIVKNEGKPKLLYINNAAVIPTAVRIPLYEFQDKIDVAYIVGLSATSSILKEQIKALASSSIPPPQWMTNTTLPNSSSALIHIKDIDTLEGEKIASIRTESKESLRTAISLALSRIITSHSLSHSYEQQKVGPLTKRKQASGVCDANDSSYCILLFTSGPIGKRQLRTLQTMAETFATDPVRFFYVDASRYQKFAIAFRFTPVLTSCDNICDEDEDICVVESCVKLVAWRPKKRRYAETKHISTTKFEQFVDQLLNGILTLPHKLTNHPSL